MTIVCVGDSITAGQHVLPERSWPSLLQRGCVNRGVPGDTTRLGLERFPTDVQALTPRAGTVLIQFGANDCNRWATDNGLPRVSPAAFAANLQEMIDRSRAAGATRAALLTIFPSLRSAGYRADTDVYNTIIRSFPDVIDVAAEIPSDPPRLLAPLLQPDGLHLSARGHQLYATIVAEALP